MTDPAALAHAVLDTVVPDVPWKIQLQEFQARAAAAPTLARAVIRVEELADRLDDGHLRYLIRTALNGETR